jgi:hypothetical protein
VKRYRIAFSVSFASDLARYEGLLLPYVTPGRAESITRRIVSFCRRLETAPLRGTDWGSGLRTLPVLGRGTILFQVDEEAGRVTILGWWWRGVPSGEAVGRYRGEQPD